jgi:hypothetical protein
MREDQLNKVALEYLATIGKHMDKDMSSQVQKKMKNMSNILRETSNLDIRLVVSPESQIVREAAWQQLCLDAHYHNGYVLLFIPFVVSWEQGAHTVKNVWKDARKLSARFSELLGCDAHVARFAIPEATMLELKPRDFKIILEQDCMVGKNLPSFSCDAEIEAIQSFYLPLAIPENKENLLHEFMSMKDHHMGEIVNDLSKYLFSVKTPSVSLFLSAADVAPDVIEQSYFDKDVISISSFMQKFDNLPSLSPNIAFNELFINLVLVWPAIQQDVNVPFITLNMMWSGPEGERLVSGHYTFKSRDPSWTELIGVVMKEAHNRSWSRLNIEQMYDLTAEQLRLSNVTPNTLQ